MKTIRPHEFFSRLKWPQRPITLTMPTQWSPTLLNTAILIGAMRLSDGDRFFEFGTGRGLTSYMLAMDGSKVTTIDVLEPPTHEGSRKVYELHAPHRKQLAYSPLKWRVEQLWGDSKDYDFSPYYNHMNVVFVDGAQDYATVARDSHNALKMARNFAFLHYSEDSDGDAPKVAEEFWAPKGAVWIEESRLVMLEVK